MAIWDWLRTLVRGVRGVGVATLQTDPADDQTVSRRRAICSACDLASRRVSTGRTEARMISATSVCKACKCNIRLKTSIESEKCPLGKW
jgi:hypothetical protein